MPKQLNHFSKLDLLLLKLLVSSFSLNLKEFRVSVFCTLVLYFLISFIVQFSRIFSRSLAKRFAIISPTYNFVKYFLKVFLIFFKNFWFYLFWGADFCFFDRFLFCYYDIFQPKTSILISFLIMKFSLRYQASSNIT